LASFVKSIFCRTKASNNIRYYQEKSEIAREIFPLQKYLMLRDTAKKILIQEFNPVKRVILQSSLACISSCSQYLSLTAVMSFPYGASL
jgi:hypothetical protein